MVYLVEMGSKKLIQENHILRKEMSQFFLTNL